MSEQVNDGKRGFLKTAMLGAGASAIGAAAPGPVLAQMLETSISESSVLAKIRKEGVINVGYAQTGPWVYKDAKTGGLGGIYKDVVDMLAKEIQIKVEWKEATFRSEQRRLRPDRPVVLQGRQDRRTRRHLQGRRRHAGEGNPDQGRVEGGHLRELDRRAAARRL